MIFCIGVCGSDKGRECATAYFSWICCSGSQISSRLACRVEAVGAVLAGDLRQEGVDPLQLTQKEFGLLPALAFHSGRICSRAPLPALAYGCREAIERAVDSPGRPAFVPVPAACLPNSYMPFSQTETYVR